MAASTRTTSFERVQYAVNTTGDTLFNPTIGSSDSPDYTAAKAEALAQSELISPQGEEVVA
tara:strand:+ start:1299 stop:1481 length:183 start_codon:yes stop_codon:yes gene_type:complete